MNRNPDFDGTLLGIIALSLGEDTLTATDPLR